MAKAKNIMYNALNNDMNNPAAKYRTLTIAETPKSSKNADKKTKSYDTYNNFNNYGNLSQTTGGSYSASGTKWYDVTKADISGLLKAYEDEAASSRQTAESNYNITRNDLLTQLKRYQEENARNVQTQKQNYLSEQANLESARESANRQSRISAAARGLAGSGLQQLAQLQNLIGQSEKVSEAAGKNQTAMDKLATALREYTEDNETKLSNALIQKNNALNTIASTLSKQKAQAIAENEQAYTNAVNARNAAMAQYSYSSSPGTTTYYGNELNSILQGATVDLRKLANASNPATIASYAEKAGLTLTESSIKKNKAAAIKKIARQIADNANAGAANAVSNYGMNASYEKAFNDDITKALKYYNF